MLVCLFTLVSGSQQLWSNETTTKQNMKSNHFLLIQQPFKYFSAILYLVSLWFLFTSCACFLDAGKYGFCPQHDVFSEIKAKVRVTYYRREENKDIAVSFLIKYIHFKTTLLIIGLIHIKSILFWPFSIYHVFMISAD